MAASPKSDAQALLSELGWMKNLARRLAADEQLAEDAVQEACVAALERPPSMGASFSGWLGVVVRNAALQRSKSDQRRRTREQRVGREEALELDVAQAVAQAEAHRKVVEALFELPEPLRTTLILRFFRNLDSAAIADRMSVSASTVRSRVHRGVERLRDRLKAEYGRGFSAFCVALLGFELPPVAGPLPVGRITPSRLSNLSLQVLAPLVALCGVVALVLPELPGSPPAPIWGLGAAEDRFDFAAAEGREFAPAPGRFFLGMPAYAGFALDYAVANSTSIEGELVYVKLEAAGGGSLEEELGVDSMYEFAVVASNSRLHDLPVSERREYRTLGAGIYEEPDFLLTARTENLPIGFHGAIEILDDKLPTWLHLAYHDQIVAAYHVKENESEVTFVVDPSAIRALQSTVSLRVVDGTTGLPVPEARVSLGDLSSQDDPQRTAVDGWITFDEVPPGRLALEITGAGLEYRLRALDVAPGSTLTLGDVVLDSSRSISGKVVDPNGDPALDARIFVVDLEYLDGPRVLPDWRHVTVDVDGEFQVDRVGDGQYLVFAQLAGYALTPTLVDTTNSPLRVIDLDLELERGIAVQIETTYRLGSSRIVTVRDDAGIVVWAERMSEESMRQFRLRDALYTLEVADEHGQVRTFPLDVDDSLPEPVKISLGSGG